jgi:uncharacterized membrane protein (UPF0182 family)
MSRTRIAGVVVLGVLVALFGGRWLAVRYTEALWYADLGRSAQFRHLLASRLLWQGLTLLAATLWYGAQTLGVYRSIGSVHLPRRVGNLEIAEAVPHSVLRAIAAGIALLLGVVTVVTFHDLADYVALSQAATPLGLPEPILGRDAAFYLARLPLLETALLMAAISVVMGIVLAAGLYALTGSLTVRARRLVLSRHARAHLVALLACLALVLAWGFQLDAYQIVGGGGGRGGAVSAVDRGLRIPVSTALAALGLVVAALTVLWLRWGRGGALAGVWATFAVLAVGGRYATPFLREVWGRGPEPTEALALADLSERYTRAGMGLLDVRPEALAARAEPDGDSLAALGRTLVGFSPWSAEPELLTGWVASAVQDNGRERLWTTTVSAYAARDGALRLAALAVPETDVLRALRTADRPDWTAFHRGALAWGGDPLIVDLEARDGRGLATASGGTPALAVADVGPVRFLAHAAELAVVGENARAPGEPPVGIPLRGFVRRLLLAWALQAPPLVGRSTAVGDRVIYWRDVPQRLARLFPFAAFDPPRAVAAGGRLVWVTPGFLASDRFPLAEHVDWHGQRVNYLRAAYVATVDAGTGETRLYLRGPGTALAAALARVARTPVLPADSLPPGLREHLGYPAALLGAQSDVLARHDGNPGQAPLAVVRSAAGAGGPGQEVARQPLTVEAVLAIGGTRALWRLVPLTDAGGNRLVGFVAGQASGSSLPLPRLLKLPSTEFATLAAAESRLNASPALVGALAAAGGTEGAAHRSPVVALPVAGTVVYAQVVYASPRRLTEPLRVRAVALMAGGRVGVGADVAGAVRALASAQSATFLEARADTTMAAVRAAYLALDSAGKRGDWAAFGRGLETLRAALGLPAERRP